MIEAGAVLRFFNQSRNLGECNAMVLFVVGHKDQEIVLVQDFAVQHRAIPFDHLLEACRTQHGVRKLRRRSGTSAALMWRCAATHCLSSFKYNLNVYRGPQAVLPTAASNRSAVKCAP